MPLEISEIGVRMAVLEPGDAAVSKGGGAAAGCGGGAQSGAAGSEANDVMVEKCVRAVLRALKMRDSR
jgi:hypothetical protein